MKKRPRPKNTAVLRGSLDADVRLAVRLLQQGEVVAVPTETVYGLGGLGLNPEALGKIYEAKDRPSHNPLILHVRNLEEALQLWDLSGCDEGVRQRINTLAAEFWPGPLTLVAPKAAHVPEAVTAGLKTLAIRVPSHPVMQRLLAALGEPLAAPSANTANRPSPTCAGHVLRTLNGRIAAVLDGGSSAGGLESTIIDARKSALTVLRLGAASPEILASALNAELATVPSGQSAHTPVAPAAPGQLAKHYSPAASRLVLMPPKALERAWPTGMPLMLRSQTFDRVARQLGPRPLNSLNFLMPDTPEQFGSRLYQVFYRIEALHLAEVGVEDLGDAKLGAAWWALQDRLLRAASERISSE